MDIDGYLYISEIYNHRVVRWEPGATKGTVVAGGYGQGKALNQLSYPMGIAIDQDKNLYIADTYNHRVQLWKPDSKEGITVLSAKDNELQSFNYCRRFRQQT